MEDPKCFYLWKKNNFIKTNKILILKNILYIVWLNGFGRGTHDTSSLEQADIEKK